ncbi:MAG: asparagine synthase (glutamine-hydrolyzing) [Pseudomonadota bacterium]
MCGIAGIYHLRGRPIQAAAIKEMTRAMTHRGPDDWGYVCFALKGGALADESYWVEARAHRPMTAAEEKEILSGGPYNLALGHTRLAVIDLTEAGHQPMSNRVNGLWLVYNGEIYNFQELRAELRSKGHHFFSRTDTEVILHLYEEHGLDFVHRLNGMFALALWDLRQGRLLLVRDRYGIKPLYYTIRDETLLFASEVKAILKYPGLQARLNERALLDYFTFQNTFGPLTLFEGVKILEPGCLIVVEAGQVREERYWEFAFTEAEDKGEDYFRRAVRDGLQAAVKRQLVADVPVGSYLSGGLDSGSITALAAREAPRLMTFTGGFDVATAVPFESLFDERAQAELMSRRFETEHYQMVIHAGDLEWALPRVINHIEDLRLGMCYPNYYLARLAGKFVKVVLGGPGGDEMLAGYPWRYRLVAEKHDPADFEETYFRYWSRLVAQEQWGEFFSDEVLARNRDHSARDSFRMILNSAQAEHPIKKALHFEAKTFLHGILLLDDKLSMAHSLESRAPLLDDAFVNLALSLPVRYLINNHWMPEAGEDENLAGKYILRLAMADLLPREIVTGRKQGFSAPEQTWYQNRLAGYITGIVLSQEARERNYFKAGALEKILDQHFSGQVNHRLLIWSLLSFEWWNRIFIDGLNP